MKDVELDDGEVTRFGFRWGPMEVTRTMTLPRGRVVTIRAGRNEIDVYVSNAGRSVRVFDSDHNEWGPRDA